MEKLIRAFMALELDEEIKISLKKIEDHLKKLDLDVKWVNPHNVHLTLKFLGEIPPPKLTSVQEIFPSLFKNFSSFEIEMDRLGVFPKIVHPKIIWVGVSKNAQHIVDLANRIEEQLGYLAIEKENKQFSPHLTIGRLKSSKNQYRLIEEIRNFSISPPLKQRFQSVSLFKSTLTPQGPVYEILQKYEFEK